MRNILFLVLILVFGCKNKTQNIKIENNKITTIINDDYELIKSSQDKALLIVFPGGGSNAKGTKEEFKILKKAAEKGISVLLMNFSRLWVENDDLKLFTKQVTEAFENNNLKTNQVFIGGMSIGGSTALTLSEHLSKINSVLKPKGVFVVDSPIDLFALYESSQKDVLRKDFSEQRLAEPKWIINSFEEQFGGKDSLLTNIQKFSPFTLKTKNENNIASLKESKLRFYTEPDTLWLKENRQTDFESSNAFILQKTVEILKGKNWVNVELIQTKDKGYRANGERNPHSWSIVNTDELINWVLE